ncbi:MAG: gamma-butyrobetaine hydroxylase-like domain-containing protein [Gammaproteobacteria bacterium]|nr:gamma-butyrobetaine hydroxylase-like domain-containing protein [Gammaproteobacteria bacterium]MCW8909567.1 gamma-butyrobetaine hydroxylase-like domain-containing protein [Gammaproteobacteria bacterium]MCW9006097.1 gamma-butyrobetaine hydroxylase-like domain-containing protein [Gammaproteobacteria bacterium]MCW9056701.1 gamma-butyrobetaine hydroxylase-like domain-containing protein [Gammaproteobacteria bacterium]
MASKHIPTEIKLHQKSKILEISFETGENFKYPCEYLRTHAKSAEIETSDIPVAGKAEVNIEKIEPQGNYALRLFFNDGYDTGIFSWDTFFDLGTHYDTNWAKYLDAIEKHGLKRSTREKPEDGKIKIKVLYFMTNMLKVTKKETEELILPESINEVQKLLKFLRFKGKEWETMFADDAVQVTVNKQFAELFTKLEHGDEVAFVPLSKDL